MISDKAELHSMFNNRGLQDTINHLHTVQRSVIAKMKVLKEQMRNEVLIDGDKLDKYLELNSDLRKLKIWLAEFVFLKNIL